MSALLNIDGLSVAYGQVSALRDVSISINAGEAVALVGANGAGKSTLFKSIVGFLRPRSGRIQFLGRDMAGVSPERRARLGLGYAPEGRRVFPGMTVRENLEVAVFASKGEREQRLQRAFALFPQLAERHAQLAWQLSGGQQQMLAIGRALMANPRVLLMDEPSEGLAPQIVAEVMATIRKLKESGLSIVLVEQNPKLVFDIADDVIILNSGRVAVVSTAAALKSDGVDLRQHLGIF
jgi:branched-chain amino acid transport system ATP-binding protein